ncbi:hypothetical protein [Endozoicomonas sp.]|uniref:hypothetical protein n=1 Tax=Endozoicomonas sp. TaxID=1892382 RepID=UPI00383AF326
MYMSPDQIVEMYVEHVDLIPEDVYNTEKVKASVDILDVSKKNISLPTFEELVEASKKQIPLPPR